MVGEIRLFEKLPDGRLSEVRADQAAALRGQRPFSVVSMVADVLWTPEEEAARDAEEAADEERRKIEQDAANSRAKRKQSALEKLAALGLSPEDVEALHG
jgi:hypothetical protein